MVLEGEVMAQFQRSFKRKTGEDVTVKGRRVLDRAAGVIVEVENFEEPVGKKISVQVEAVSMFNGTLRVRPVEVKV